MSGRNVPRESAVRGRIVAALREAGAKVIPYPASAEGEVGTPDLVGCYRGAMFLIETKRTGGKLSRIQDLRIEQWRKAGARAGRAESVDDALVIALGL